jgi:hypothetical protein
MSGIVCKFNSQPQMSISLLLELGLVLEPGTPPVLDDGLGSQLRLDPERLKNPVQYVRLHRARFALLQPGQDSARHPRRRGEFGLFQALRQPLL